MNRIIIIGSSSGVGVGIGARNCSNGRSRLLVILKLVDNTCTCSGYSMFKMLKDNSVCGVCKTEKSRLSSP